MLLRKVDLPDDSLSRYPHAFSGGQRQRLCIARALMPGPDVVVLDEAVSALDVSVQAKVLDLLIDLQRDLGLAYVFVTHDMAVVERISHRIAVLYGGRIVEIGDARAVLSQPRHPYTQKLIAAVPSIMRRRVDYTLATEEVPLLVRANGVGTPTTGLGRTRTRPPHRTRTGMTFDAAWSLVRDSVTAGRIPGAVLGVTGEKREVAATGRAVITPDDVTMTEDTIFDLASLTKVIFTTERILAHAQAGRIDLDAPLTSVIPDFRQYDAGCWERQVTFRDCLAHRTHFPAVAPIYTYGADPGTLRAFVCNANGAGRTRRFIPTSTSCFSALRWNGWKVARCATWTPAAVSPSRPILPRPPRPSTATGANGCCGARCTTRTVSPCKDRGTQGCSGLVRLCSISRTGCWPVVPIRWRIPCHRPARWGGKSGMTVGRAALGVRRRPLATPVLPAPGSGLILLQAMRGPC